MCCDCVQLEKDKSSLDQDNKRLEQEIKLLKEMLRLERQRKFGSSSEQTNPDQPELDGMFEDQSEDAEIEAVATEHIEYDRSKGKNKNLNGRVEIPEHLERREILLDLPEDQKICPVTGKEMIKIGEDITEQLAIEPPKFYVNKYIRPKYASPDRRKGAKAGVKTASLPDGPIDRCKADVSLLPSIIVSKYADHLPLYRQQQQFERYGIKIPASTMCDWANNCAETLKPLYNELRKIVLSYDYLQVDETPIDLLRKKQKKREARLWAVRTGSGPPGIFFHFTESREQKHAKKLLASFSGTLQTDAYSGYLKVGERKDVTLLSCLAHLRRKYIDTLKARDKRAEAFITLTGLNTGLLNCRTLCPMQ
jgi:transposase